MIEKAESPQSDTTTPTPSELAEALNAVKSSSPELAAALDAAQVNPDELAAAHHRATSEEPDQPPA